MEQYLVLDLGGTFIKYALMQQNGKILRQGKVISPVDTMDHFLTAFEPLRQEFAGEYAGVAVSMPGRIDTARGIAHSGGMFKFIKDDPIAQLLSDCFQAPVTIANDGKCAVKAEAWDGALADVDNGAVIVLGTGTGGGLLLNRRVWMGSNFAAGELSVFGMDFKKMTDGCKTFGEGREAFWCGWMSAGGILTHYAAYKGIDPASVDGYAFFDSYEVGEPVAVQTLQEFGKMAAAGIYSLQSVLDLQKIAIGGGISARPEVTEVIRSCVERQFNSIVFSPLKVPQIVTCKYGNNANLLGALRFHLEQEND